MCAFSSGEYEYYHHAGNACLIHACIFKPLGQHNEGPKRQHGTRPPSRCVTSLQGEESQQTGRRMTGRVYTRAKIF